MLHRKKYNATQELRGAAASDGTSYGRLHTRSAAVRNAGSKTVLQLVDEDPHIWDIQGALRERTA